MIARFFDGSKVFYLFWIVVSLGSCTYIQTNDNRVFTLSLQPDQTESGCGEFKRSIHLDHKRPIFPKVDIASLSPDEINDLLMSHTEKLIRYLDNEERFLLEDIIRHNQKCAPDEPVVFQK
ncbi:hypothetical protein PA10_00076 [Pseudomonas phage pPa_SNUABM_DT01]|nr:hypothetical protein PA10_00076 [Pseudomonas phage pPa_SNUABM_DT01]